MDVGKFLSAAGVHVSCDLPGYKQGPNQLEQHARRIASDDTIDSTSTLLRVLTAIKVLNGVTPMRCGDKAGVGREN